MLVVVGMWTGSNQILATSGAASRQICTRIEKQLDCFG
jgi:hypothetical protein